MSLLNPLKVAEASGCSCNKLTTKEKYQRLDELLELYQNEPGNLISCLYLAQSIFGYLPDDVLNHVAMKMGYPASKVVGVATFYSFFTRFPKGKYTVKVCLGTACYVRGAEKLLEKFKKELGIKVGETTPDGLFSLEVVRCLGACALAPVLLVNNTTHRKVKVNSVNSLIAMYKKEAEGAGNGNN